MEPSQRERRIYRVTLTGSLVNVLLLVFKFVCGILGGSAAMIADAVHSLSDFLTDIVVLVFVRISSKPEDRDHGYGHGKYETMATSLVGLSLAVVGVMIMYNGVRDVVLAMLGRPLQSPGAVALVAALVSIVLKEWTYRFTLKAGRACRSQAVIANAWHHRSDALSSTGTALGIGGAILFGSQWAVLDPIAAVVVSVFILRTSWRLVRESAGELLEQSLPEEVERDIISIVTSDSYSSEVHHLRTRRIGSQIAIEMHIRMPGDMTLYESHLHASWIEQQLRRRFGPRTHIGLHVEPQKVAGQYVNPKASLHDNPPDC